MTDKYVLEGHTAVPCHSLMEWARWLESANRRVEEDVIADSRISTVFLGIDHQYGDGPPLIFETMIFGGAHNEYQERYSTWDEAVAGHKRAISLVRSALA